MVSLNPLEVTKNQQNEEQEEDENESIEDECMEDSLQLSNIPIDVTK